jgi:hypothetical protein
MTRKPVTAPKLSQRWKIQRRPGELRIKVQIKAPPKMMALSMANVHVFANLRGKSLLNSVQNIPIFSASTSHILKVPKPVVNIKIGPFQKRAFRISENPLQILRWVPIRKIVMKAMKRKIDLSERWPQKSLHVLFSKQDPVGYEENPCTILITDIDEFRKLGMNQRITHQMKANLIGDWTDLLDNFAKQSKVHPLFGSHYFRAETALKITNIADLNIDLRKALHT